MSTFAKTSSLRRQKRHARVRARISGTAELPRLLVFKSSRYLHVQIIDDVTGATLVAGSTMGMKGTKTETAVALGTDLAARAKKAGVTSIVFDRGGFRFTGRIAAFAAAVREAGIKF